MASKRSPMAAAAASAAIGAVAFGPQLFAQTGPGAPSQGVPSLRSGAALQHAASEAAAPGSSTASPFMGLGAAGAVFLAARAAGGRVNGKSVNITRNFFGGDSFAAAPSFEVSKQSGIQEPIGFFDPLGLSADNDEATFKRRRTVEIKHGRVAMFATMGYITPFYFKFPGDLSPSLGLKFADVPNGLAAVSKVPLLGWFQILWFAGLIEGSGFFSGKYGLGLMKDTTMDGEPGNYGAGFPTFLGKVTDPEARKTKLAAELANGRLAMMAIIGMFFQDGLTGSAWGDWSLYTASPLRAVGSTSSRGQKVARNFFGGDSFAAAPSFEVSKQSGIQ
ncbi:unnamed protein product, partial [Polarella glacialis]